MSLATQKNRKYPLVLEVDREQPNPPTFYARHLNGHEWQEIIAALEVSDTADTVQQRIASLYDALPIALCEWANVVDRDGKSLEFGRDGFLRALDLESARDVLRMAMDAQRVGYADAKKSASQSQSPPGTSAMADASPVSVETAPANPSPQA